MILSRVSWCFLFLCASLLVGGCSLAKKQDPVTLPAGKKIGILLGSTRQESTTAKLGLCVQKLVKKELGVDAQILDLTEHALPLLYESQAPAKRTLFPDAAIKNWSETIQNLDAFIMIVPEYNSGYPGVFKNSLDLLYKEWSNKPVLLITHSGGPSGGAGMAESLQPIFKAFAMKPVAQTVTLPLSWKLLTAEGTFADTQSEEKIISGLHSLSTLIVAE